MIKMVGLCI